MEALTQFEEQLWHNGKHAMLFNLDDDAVINIIRWCIDNRGMDKNCPMENLKYNLIPISEIKSFMEYISRYNSKIMSECFNSLVTISRNHRFAFRACASMYIADKYKITDKRVDQIKEMLREYDILDYMQQFNNCMEHILNKESEVDNDKR